MPLNLNLSDDAILVLRFLRALGLAAFAVAALAVTVAMFWRDIGLVSFFDQWFGSWTELELTVLAVAFDVSLYVAVRATQKSEAKIKRRMQGQ